MHRPKKGERRWIMKEGDRERGRGDDRDASTNRSTSLSSEDLLLLVLESSDEEAKFLDLSVCEEGKERSGQSKSSGEGRQTRQKETSSPRSEIWVWMSLRRFFRRARKALAAARRSENFVQSA